MTTVADSSVLTESTPNNASMLTEGTDNNVSMLTEGTGANTSVAGRSKRRKSRHRNRKVYADILRQMEFYMSDANLHKDKFLQKHMLSDGWIEVSLFADFNKMKAITTDKRVLLSALSKSPSFEVSADGKKVRRKSPYVPPKSEDVDARTIYLEPIPSDADHSFVVSMLKPVGGRIVYVSLPRFKRSRQLKGFAFVEFDSAEASKKACQIFSPPSPSGQQTPTAGDLGKFPHSNKQLEALKRRSVDKEKDKEKGHHHGNTQQNDGPKHVNDSCENKVNEPTPSTGNSTLEQVPTTETAGSASGKFWVIPKSQWLELKKAYLALQKERISALKQVVEGKNPCNKRNEGPLKATDDNCEASKKIGSKRKIASTVSSSNVKAKHIKFDDDGEMVKNDDGSK